MKILYITMTGFDTFAGNNHLNETLIKKLLKDNNIVTLIQSNQFGNYDSIPKTLKNETNLKVININKKKINKRSRILRYYNENRMAKKIYKAAKSEMEHDIIFLQYSGDSLFLTTKLFKFNKPIIYNLQDLFPDSLITTKMVKKGMIYKLLKARQIKSFSKISKFAVLSKDIGKVLSDKYEVDKSKIEIVYNWYDEEKISEIKKNENKFAKKYGLQKNNKKVIQYAGNLGYVLDYDFLINYFLKFRNMDEIEIQIIGNGSNEQKLKKLVAEKCIKNISFYDIQPYDIVSDVYSYADLVFIPLKKGVIYHSVPSKLSLVMACKRPALLITDQDSKYFDMLIKNKSIVNSSGYDVEMAFSETIKLFDNKSVYEKIVGNAYEFTNTKFSFSNNYKTIKKFFQT